MYLYVTPLSFSKEEIHPTKQTQFLEYNIIVHNTHCVVTVKLYVSQINLIAHYGMCHNVEAAALKIRRKLHSTIWKWTRET